MSEENKFSGTKQQSGKEKLKAFWNTKAVPFMGKVGNQRHLSSIRDAFATMLPLIISGSIGLLIQTIIFGGAGSNKISLLALIAKLANPAWDWDATTFAWPTAEWADASTIAGLAFGYISVATIGTMSLYFTFLLGYFLASSRGFDFPLMAGLASLAGVIVASMGQITFFMDAKGLISALIIGILCSEIFVYFSKMKRLTIKLPASVPPAVSKSFSVFLPMLFTLGSVAMLNLIFLAPAIASTNWSVNTFKSNVSSQSDLWTKTLDFDAFKAYLTANGLNLADVINGTEAEAKALFDTWGDATTVQGVNEFFESLQNIFKDERAYNLFGQFAFNSLTGAEGDVFSNLTDIGQTWFRHNVSIDENGQVLVILIQRWEEVTIGSQQFGFSAAIFKFFTSWFIGFATGSGGLGLAIVYTLFVSIFWFFGIHGSNVMAAIFEPIWLMLLGINATLITAGLPANVGDNPDLGVFSRPFFDIYMYIGGTGATLGLLIMTLIISRRRELREVAKFALPSGVFNVNEPCLFGYPIILNGKFFIPFLLAPVAGMLVGYIATGPLAIINVPYIAVPWTTPFFLSAFLATSSPLAILVALIAFGMATAVWVPFIILDNVLYYKNLKKTDPEAYAEEMKYRNDKEYRNGVKATLKEENRVAKEKAKERAEKEKAKRLQEKEAKKAAKEARAA